MSSWQLITYLEQYHGQIPYTKRIRASLWLVACCVQGAMRATAKEPAPAPRVAPSALNTTECSCRRWVAQAWAQRRGVRWQFFELSDQALVLGSSLPAAYGGVSGHGRHIAIHGCPPQPGNAKPRRKHAAKSGQVVLSSSSSSSAALPGHRAQRLIEQPALNGCCRCTAKTSRPAPAGFSCCLQAARLIQQLELENGSAAPYGCFSSNSTPISVMISICSSIWLFQGARQGHQLLVIKGVQIEMSRGNQLPFGVVPDQISTGTLRSSRAPPEYGRPRRPDPRATAIYTPAPCSRECRTVSRLFLVRAGEIPTRHSPRLPCTEKSPRKPRPKESISARRSLLGSVTA